MPGTVLNLASGSLGVELPLWSTIPFLGILLSIALLPLLAPKFWHHHFGKVALFWSAAFLGPFAIWKGWEAALEVVGHVYALDFVPFIILIWSLYTVAGGIRIRGRFSGRPLANTGVLAVGTLLASWMGTTGAAMVLIRPLIRANAWRRHRVHTIVFFIFLVANIGGSLTPLGDPPLFLGFLRGVPFLWTATHLIPETGLSAAALLLLYLAIDALLVRRETGKPPASDGERIGIEGGINILLLGGIVATGLLSGVLAGKGPFYDAAVAAAHRPAIEAAGSAVREAEATLRAAPPPERGARKSEVLEARARATAAAEARDHEARRHITLGGGVHLPWLNVARDGALLLLGLASLALTRRATREGNGFTWGPIAEVAKLFAGIFVTIIPALEILKAGPAGALRSLVLSVTRDDGGAVDRMYFWLTGALSSFLDNAPTYLVFFNTAGGDAARLTTEGASTLAAISAGAVFMGANTYIGNAPNFMVRSIAEESGIRMPSFFGYVFRWSVPVLIPLFVLLTVLFF